MAEEENQMEIKEEGADDVTAICSGLPALTALNLTNNMMSQTIVGVSDLKNLRLLVLNNASINWSQVEVLKDSLQVIEELHLMGNKLREITGALGIEMRKLHRRIN